MQDWAYHYQLAEALLKKSTDPVTSASARQEAVAKAQAHATLASVQYRTEKSPRVSPKRYN